jgi:Ser/Thr protein kinase RdoA (MazF antagonist)
VSNDNYPEDEGGLDDNLEDNRGNLISSLDEDVTEAAPPSIEDHPYQQLTPDVVIDAVESTGRLSDARILALNSYENRVYQVGIDQGEPVIVKFYRPDRWTVAQIVEEHVFTQKLYDLEIPVVPPLVIAESDTPTLAMFKGFYFSIYPRQGGRAPELDNLDHLYQLGQFIGRIHAVGASYPFQHRIDLQVKAFGHNSVAYLLDNGFIPSELRAAYESISKELLLAIEGFQIESDAFTSISLHGDCHPGNVLWRDDRPHFVDFDDAMTGPAIQDLWMLLSGDTANKQRQLSEIVEGYEQFYPFNTAELRLIEPLRALRVLNYSAWLARRWHDPAFPASFPWFNTERYWSEHILELKELVSALAEPVLSLPDSV